MLLLILSSGTFSQYDTMIYPPTESVLKQLKGILSKQEREKHPEIHCPPPEEMRELCLILYLKVYEPVLKSECMPDSTSKLVSDVVQIYLQLAEHLIYIDSKVSMAPPSYEEWPVENLKKVRINHNRCLLNFIYIAYLEKCPQFVDHIFSYDVCRHITCLLTFVLAVFEMVYNT